MIRRFLLGLLFALPTHSVAVPSDSLASLRTAAEQRNMAESPEWRMLLHYRPKVTGLSSESQADDARFFFATNGKTDPGAELDASITAFVNGDRQAVHPQCRFPARFHWLKQQGEPFRQIPEVPCPELEQWLKDLNTAQVTLVFASSYLNSPSSMFGHTFLRLDPPNLDQRNPILANTISYAADAGQHDNELAFAYRGIFGGYPGITTVEPYYDKVKLYSKLENRDLWEYRLNLTADEVRQLLRHTWEIKDKRFDYYFFDENCAYRILALIDIARPGTDLIPQVGTLRAIPSDTVRVVLHNNLVDSVNYRPSQETLLRNQISQLTAEEQDQAALAFEEKQIPSSDRLTNTPPDRLAAILETAYEFTRYRTQSDQLSREATADLSYALLQQRSRVKAPSRLTAPLPPTIRDDEGHPTGRATLTAGRYAERNFVQLALRPAYHDLHDPAAGYRKGSQLQFLNLEMRHYIRSGELQLEQLNLVEILSLSPRDRFFQPLSWSAGFGADRQLLESGERPLAPYVGGSAGHSYELGPSLVYGMVTAALRVSSHLPDGFQVAPGIAAGWSMQSDRSAWHIKAGSRFYPEQDSDPLHQASVSVDWHWQPGWSLTLELGRENSGDIYATNAQAGFRIYF